MVSEDPDSEQQESALRQWLVAGAVVYVDDRLLLVQNRRRNGDLDWSTPGGVIDAGEEVLEGLGREVQEETGLVVSAWSEILYKVHVRSPDFGFELHVEAYRAAQVTGRLVVDDPDGIVVSHFLADLASVRSKISGSDRFVSEPLLAHLEDGIVDGRTFAYRLDKTSSGRRVVPVTG